MPTACITDMDVMPDCAPEILSLKGVKGAVWPDKSDRRWRAMKDFGATAPDLEKASRSTATSEQKVTGNACAHTLQITGRLSTT